MSAKVALVAEPSIRRRRRYVGRHDGDQKHEAEARALLAG